MLLWTCVYNCLRRHVFISLGSILTSGIAGSNDNTGFNIEGTAKPLPSDRPSSHSDQQRVSASPCPSRQLLLCPFHVSHPSEVVFPWGLVCSPNDSWCWASFHVPTGHLYVFLGKHIQIPCSLPAGLFVLASCETLYILAASLLSDTWFASMFSRSVGYIFVFFEAPLFFILVKSNLPVFFCHLCFCRSDWINYMSNPRPWRCTLVFLLGVLEF